MAKNATTKHDVLCLSFAPRAPFCTCSVNKSMIAIKSEYWAPTCMSLSLLSV